MDDSTIDNNAGQDYSARSNKRANLRSSRLSRKDAKNAKSPENSETPRPRLCLRSLRLCVNQIPELLTLHPVYHNSAICLLHSAF